MNLSELTTLRLGGPAREVVEARTELELVAALDADVPTLVLGQGSNVVVGDDGFDGRVVLVRTRGIDVFRASDATGMTARVAAGEPWVGVVEHCVSEGLAGVECLAGIPGLAGATPIQNVGAYGQEVSSTITSVRVLDLKARAVRVYANADCGFGYRTSRFKQAPGAALVLSVDYRLRVSPVSEPIEYGELAQALGVSVGGTAPSAEVAEAVLSLRRGKGMVVDDADPDTRSAGSFFTNPRLAPDAVPAGAPSWPQPDGSVKVSAAWLIEQAGFSRGWGDGAAGISTKHTLALTNRGGATTADLLTVAGEIRDGVRAKFGVVLVPEPVLINCAL